MSKQVRFKNVEPRHDRGSIRIKFDFRGVACRETLPLAPTNENIKIAAKELERINRSIVLGTFDYALEYPLSPNLKKLGITALAPVKKQTFGELAKVYLKSKSHLEIPTLDTYNDSLRAYWLPLFSDTPIDQISYSDLTNAIGSVKWGTPKTRNNALIPLRGVFELAWRDELIDRNPCERIENQKHQKPKPDPLSLDEVEMVLGHMLKKYGQIVHDYFEFAFFTGLRIEEQIALKWEDVDFNRKQVRVQRARSGGVLKSVKTHDIRDVTLNSRAMDALQRQKAVSFLQYEYIWLNPVTNEPWSDTGKAQRIRYWSPTLKQLGVRYRPPKVTRSTYATIILMSGANPAYGAKQLGHSMTVFLGTYSKWLDSSHQVAEAGRIESFIIPTESPKIIKDKNL